MKRCTQTFYEKVSSRYIYFFSHKVCLQKSFPVWFTLCPSPACKFLWHLLWQGAAGQNGAPGERGEAGAPGATGPQGPAGQRGPAGPTVSRQLLSAYVKHD